MNIQNIERQLEGWKKQLEKAERRIADAERELEGLCEHSTIQAQCIEERIERLTDRAIHCYKQIELCEERIRTEGLSDYVNCFMVESKPRLLELVKALNHAGVTTKEEKLFIEEKVNARVPGMLKVEGERLSFCL